MRRKSREKAEDVQVSPKGDETHRMNETCGKSKGKGNGGKGEHGGKGDRRGKGSQQSVKMLKGEEVQETDEEDEWVQVAPNMGAGGSHPQATTDPEEGRAEEQKRGTRNLRWADCDDKEEEEGWTKKVMRLDCSDDEQEGQEEAAEEREERRKREESEERARRK